MVDVFQRCTTNYSKFECGDLKALTSSNSGVLVQGTCYTNLLDNYYGRLQKVMRLSYSGRSVVVFKCHWFDTFNQLKVRKGVVTVNVKSKLRTDDVFVLASQAVQVYFAPNVVNAHDTWYTVMTLRNQYLDESTSIENDDAFQGDSSNTIITEMSSEEEPVYEYVDDIPDLSNNKNEEEDDGEDTGTDFVIVDEVDEEEEEEEEEEEDEDNANQESDDDGFDDIN